MPRATRVRNTSAFSDVSAAMRDGLADRFTGQRQRRLADLLLAPRKWKYSEPRGEPPAARMSCSAVP